MSAIVMVIFLMTSNNANGGVSVTTLDFKTMEACIMARKTILEHFYKTPNSNVLRIVCVERTWA